MNGPKIYPNIEMMTRPLNATPTLSPRCLAYEPPGRVRAAVPEDLTWMTSLQDRLHDYIGYTPRGALLDRILHRRIIVAEYNDDPAGFVTFTHRLDGTTHLPQLGVHPDLWRTHLGSQLWASLERSARCHASRYITLKCAYDLPANYFWGTVGCVPLGVTRGHRRMLNVWVRPLRGNIPVFLRPPKSPRIRPITRRGTRDRTDTPPGVPDHH